MTTPPAGRKVVASERQRLEKLRELTQHGERDLDELLAMRTDPSWAVRREVIAALGRLGLPAATRLCESLIRERDDETRIAATVDALVASTGDAEAALYPLTRAENVAVLADLAQILGRRRNPLSVPILADLSRHRDDNVAVAAIEALGRVGGRAVVDLLVETVESRRFFRTFAAIDVLGKSGDPRAISPLVALLDDPHYSFEAARALGRSSDSAAVAPLGRLLCSPADGQVRVAALALADLRQKHGERFGTTEPVDSALAAAPSVATRRLAQCLSGSDPNEQVAIITIMGCLRDEAAIPALVMGLDGAPEIAQAAAVALGQLSRDSDIALVASLWEGSSARRQALLPTLSGSRALEAVAGCLRDPEAVVRRLACEALARIGSPRAVPELFHTLNDPNPAVVQAAISAIASLGYDDTPALAVAAARSGAAPVRRAALRILSYAGSPEAMSVFEVGTRDADPRVREAAIQGLPLLESSEALDLLLGLTNEPLPQTRASALRALGDCTLEPRIVHRLELGLSDPEPWVRYYACQSLGKLRAEACAGAVAELVSDPAGQVRLAAIEALSHLPGDLAFATLRDAARSAELELRRAALIGLGLSRRGEALTLLLEHTSSPDAATRLIALSALASFGTAEALAVLVRAVRDPEENVHLAALGLLGTRSGAEATQLLASFATDPVLGERAQAVLSTPGAHRVAGLLAALQAADDELAVQLTRLLARLNEPGARAALFECLTLGNTAARKAAATTLGALGNREAFSALQRLSIEDPDAEVRRVCSLLLAR